MTAVTTFWIVLYICSALLFFGTAAVIIVIGTRDLRDLLSKSDRSDRTVH